jgi:hypothetical protein
MRRPAKGTPPAHRVDATPISVAQPQPTSFLTLLHLVTALALFVAIFILSGGLRRGKEDIAHQPGYPTAVAIPDYCLEDPQLRGPIDAANTTRCVEELAAQTALNAARFGVTANLCWPRQEAHAHQQQQRQHGHLSDADILDLTHATCAALDSRAVFHTVALGRAPPPVFGPFLHAFFATQCCDAELWVWSEAPLTAAQVGKCCLTGGFGCGIGGFPNSQLSSGLTMQVITEHSIPLQHQDRLRVLPLDVKRLWRAVDDGAAFAGVLPKGVSGSDVIIKGYYDKVSVKALDVGKGAPGCSGRGDGVREGDRFRAWVIGSVPRRHAGGCCEPCRRRAAPGPPRLWRHVP